MIKQLKVLLGMVVLGSIIGLEHSQAFGCVVGLEMLSIEKLVFFVISSGLIIQAIRTPSSKLRIKLLLIELVLWVLKYLFYKGGYITGFEGVADPINVIYDFLAIGLRVWIIMSLINQTKTKIIGALLTPALIVALKINVFAFPLYSKVMWELEDKRTAKQRIQLVGDYSGTISQLSHKQVKSIQLRIDSNLLSIEADPPFKLKKTYLFDLDYPDFGGIGTKDGRDYEVLIEHLNEDSLIMNFAEFYEEKYQLKLRAER